MKVINLSEKDSVLNKFLAELRDVAVQGDRMRFRQNVVRVGHIEAYEISKYLTYSRKAVRTPLDTCMVSTYDDDVVIGTVFRAGLPLHQSFLDIFDGADNAFVSAYRYYKDNEKNEVGIKVEYCASPALDGKTLILVDPMLATGGSMELAYEALKANGTPDKLVMACVIAAQSGVDYLQKCFPSDDVVLVCGAIDPRLNEHKYIVPGLGDAGDLMYGEKL
ncbi:MAG: uracil phosphoribosyltransferase [Bacteroidaceae bacterium]|nr:uracil phosphoribosyltransferase [Bacteroidaceae bacterium]